MKRASGTFAVLAVLFVALIAFAHVVNAEPTLANAVVAPREAPPQALDATPITEASEPVEPAGTVELAGYVLESVVAWDRGVKVSGARTRLASIARDVAWVALEQPRVWSGSDGAREAILLARLAWFESRLRDYVDDGSCQVWAAQCMTQGPAGPYCDFAKLPKGNPRDSMQLGTCDGGLSVSLWQARFGDRGISLATGAMALDTTLGDVVDRAAAQNYPVTDAGGDLQDYDQRLAWHRRNAARAALAIARRSIQQGAGLRWYVGGDGPDRASMAAQRLDSAESWSRAHPYRQ